LTLVSEPKGLAKASKSAIILLAAKEPRKFIQSIGQRLSEVASGKLSGDSLGPKEHAQALIIMGRLIKKVRSILVLI